MIFLAMVLLINSLINVYIFLNDLLRGEIINFKLKSYFLRDVLTPWMHLEDIYLDDNHSEHENLMEDLNLIKYDDALKYYKKHETKINFLNRKIPDVMLHSKILLLGELIANSIFEDRLEALLMNKPYDLEEFNDIYDDEFLIDVKKSNIEFSNSILINNNRYGLCLPINAFNSSYWINQELNKLNLSKVDLKIRVDPFLKNFKDMMYFSTVFSQPLNWGKIINLKNEDKGLFQNYQTGELTEYLWKPRNNEVVFTCEELPSEENINLRGSRYFHAIFEKDTGKFKHCDGSIIIYDKKKFDKRSKLSIDDNKINGIGDEIKLFRVDGDIPKEQFMSLITSYFYWNYDLLGYFYKNLIK